MNRVLVGLSLFWSIGLLFGESSFGWTLFGSIGPLFGESSFGGTFVWSIEFPLDFGLVMRGCSALFSELSASFARA